MASEKERTQKFYSTEEVLEFLHLDNSSCSDETSSEDNNSEDSKDSEPIMQESVSDESSCSDAETVFDP